MGNLNEMLVCVYIFVFGRDYTLKFYLCKLYVASMRPLNVASCEIEKRNSSRCRVHVYDQYAIIQHAEVVINVVKCYSRTYF